MAAAREYLPQTASLVHLPWPVAVLRVDQPAPTPAIPSRAPAARRYKPRSGSLSAASFFDPHFPEHSRFHMEQQMTVIRPSAQGVRGHAIRAFRPGRHVHGVLAHVEVALVVL